jgi:hypothetical protein
MGTAIAFNGLAITTVGVLVLGILSGWETMLWLVVAVGDGRRSE